MLTMEEAMKQSAMRFAVGEIVKGTVIELRPKEVLVDIGYKSEGVIPTNEFVDPNALKVGDEIDVLIEKLENKDGTVVLSHEKAEFKKNWDASSPSATRAAHPGQGQVGRQRRPGRQHRRRGVFARVAN